MFSNFNKSIFRASQNGKIIFRLSTEKPAAPLPDRLKIYWKKPLTKLLSYGIMILLQKQLSAPDGR